MAAVQQSASAAREGYRGAIAPGHRDTGHGRRLRDAIAAFETLPVLAESRRRATALLTQDGDTTHEIAAVIESDVSLTVAVLRAANRSGRQARGTVETVGHALNVLSVLRVREIVAQAPTFDFFANTTRWDAAAGRSRRHAIATTRAAGAIAQTIDYPHRDRLIVTSLLHDIGALILMWAYPGYPSKVHGAAVTPTHRVARERDVLGVDHALVGGVLARRWGLPATIASAIERHHAADAAGEAAVVRLADMLAHYQHGGQVGPAELYDAARALGLDASALRRLLYDLPTAAYARRRHPQPCPLSWRERDLLARLADGKVAKEIAFELGLVSSTVRTHLHNVYSKLGVSDRAQAVLHAAERGWV